MSGRRAVRCLWDACIVLDVRVREKRWGAYAPPLKGAMSRKLPATTTPTVRSALWAAWGDALGFPTELTRDEKQVQKRLDAVFAQTTASWRRRIGGRYGPTVELPAGTYSDDTQLRLAVGRCIRGADRFDVEAFSKIELSVFLSYALGAGRGTKAAANSLEKRAVRWYSNFFATRTARYVDGGGNGAAMRVQPHIWASPGFRPGAYLGHVIRDAVSTHGHPRGIVGAALHALSLGTTLREGAIPEPKRWAGMADYLERLTEMIRSDETLSERWLPRWERESGVRWSDGLGATLEEAKTQLHEAADTRTSTGAIRETYAELAGRLGGLTPETRGGGVTSAVLALWIAWVSRDDPEAGLLAAANLLGSDTDTVASMAGALVGATAQSEPPGAVADQKLVIEEAVRLERLRGGEVIESFPHPDPLNWHPPRTQADAVGLVDGRLGVAGLGPASEDSEIYVGQRKDAGLWQWLRLDFGQRVLIKRRPDLAPLPDYARPRCRPIQAEQYEMPVERAGVGDLPETVEDAVELLKRHDFDKDLMSTLLIHFARQPYGVSKASLFGGLVAQAVAQNRRRDRTPDSVPTANVQEPLEGVTGERDDAGRRSP